MVNVTAAVQTAISVYAAAVQLGGNSSVPLKDVGSAMAKLYLPGFTSFTLGAVTPLTDPATNITVQLTAYNQSGIGTDIRYSCSRVEQLSDQSAIAWITWGIVPKNGLAPWEFTDIYGFRIAPNRSDPLEGGWEWSNADDEYEKLYAHDPKFPARRWLWGV